jgi:hypothetical protein
VRDELRIRWAPKLRTDRLVRLYESDAKGMLDAELVDEVGWRLWERLAVTRFGMAHRTTQLNERHGVTVRTPRQEAAAECPKNRAPEGHRRPSLTTGSERVMAGGSRHRASSGKFRSWQNGLWSGSGVIGRGREGGLVLQYRQRFGINKGGRTRLESTLSSLPFVSLPRHRPVPLSRVGPPRLRCGLPTTTRTLGRF